MNVQQNINRLLKAIRLKGIDIKIDRIEFYSEKLEKYCYKYSVYIRKNEKYVLQEKFFNKVKLLTYLVDKYKKIGSEANGK